MIDKSRRIPFYLLVLALALSIADASWRNDFERGKSVEKHFISAALAGENVHMTIHNMTCNFFTQPLNHFVPRGRSPTYQQRYCMYSEYASNNTTSPILFYTGNESPLEQYINHTGLMWELAPVLKARIVFVEHRYEGLSLPNVTSQCLSYASTIQALADYARILELQINPRNEAPVFAFGGSYGGMLSAWFRMKYPHLVTGAIAASAPIAGFPRSAMTKISSSARVLAAGLGKAYPPDESYKTKTMEINHCPNNLLAAWPLISWMAQQNESGDFLKRVFKLCEPLGTDARPLLSWAQSIWFDMAEGSFPYPSNYIPFALIHKNVDLPPWPTQDACWKSSMLHKDWGVTFSGNISDVRYTVTYGNSGLSLNVDWDNVSVSSASSIESMAHSADLVGLLESVRDAVSVWYNITKDVECYDISQAAPNSNKLLKWNDVFGSATTAATSTIQSRQLLRDKKDPAQICLDAMKEMGSWSPLCCNDELNLIITEATGMGSDFFWPPAYPRGTNNYKDIVQRMTPEACSDPDGIFGFSKEPYDPWSSWLEAYYGSGSNMEGHSSIIFSNGLLDPWSAGGVYEEDPWKDPPYDGPMVQEVNQNDVVALIIPNGGHHTDLMYSSESDPKCVTKARTIQRDYLFKWINKFESTR